MEKTTQKAIIASTITALLTTSITLGTFLIIKDIGPNTTKNIQTNTLKTDTQINNTKQQNNTTLTSKINTQDQIIKIVENSNPAVVSIIIKQEVPIYERTYEEDPFFQDFFGHSKIKIPRLKEKGTEKKEIGGGSGFIVSKDGYIVTNKHVVNSKNAEYTVFLNDGTKYKAYIKSTDPLNDIAILKINPDKDLPFLTFGDSSKLKPGQTVIAIGNPLLEFSNSISVGVISGLGRSIVAGSPFGKSEQIENVIQTDAAINPGNSGGPLIDLNGKVIGVNVAIASGENLGFSLPSNLVKSVYESVKEYGEIVRPYLGVRFMPINNKIKEANNLNIDYGVIILRGEKPEELAVIPGSPADKAGLQENDIILEINGKKLNEKTSLTSQIAMHKVGDEITLKIQHKGKEKEIKIKLEKLNKTKNK